MSFIEILVVLAIIGIASGIAALNLRPLGNYIDNAASEMAGTLKQVRARAMSTTSAYRISRASDTQLIVEFADGSRCDSSDWQEESRLNHEFREGVRIKEVRGGDDDVIVCFNPRGLASRTPTVILSDANERERSVSVYLGGAVRVE